MPAEGDRDVFTRALERDLAREPEAVERAALPRSRLFAPRLFFV
jgi:hypothetical protein